MVYRYYQVSRFKDNVAYQQRQWNNIREFMTHNDAIDGYLNIEDSFVAFLFDFFNYHSRRKKEGYTNLYLSANLMVNSQIDNLDKRFFLGLSEVKERLYHLHQQNILYCSDEELDFLFRCWIRGLCTLFLFRQDPYHHLLSTNHDFVFSLVIHQNSELNEIFKPDDNLFFHVSKDPDLSVKTQDFAIDFGELAVL